MIKLKDILSERHKNTPNERISKYKERIQNLKDKIAKATDNNSDTVKLQKNQIKVIQQTMNNFKQTQAIKKEKEKSKLSEILKESIIVSLLINIAVAAAIWAIKQAILSFRETSVKEKEIGKAYIKWLDRLDKNDKFNKFVYYTLKNDNKLKSLESKAKDGNFDFEKFVYQKSLVKKWLTSKPAEDELEKVFKELYPNKDKSSKDIPTDTLLNVTYFQWKLLTLNKAVEEFTNVLNSGHVKGFINQYAEKQGLNKI
jgi:hypothetical protein